MSKGKRKSDREALELVRQRLRCQTVHFTEQDRAVLSLLCRTDIIQIIEVDLGLGPLRTSQKNSVATMVGWLLARSQPLPVVTHKVEVDDGSGDSEGVIAGQDTDLSPSSGGGSCHTPSSDTEEEQQQQQQQGQQQQQQPLLHTAMQLAVAPEMPAELDEHPWLTELHQQLEAAGNVRTLRADSTGTDETAGTEVDSAWVPPQPGAAASDEQQFGGLTNVVPGPSSDFGTSQLEEQLFNQLLLDMDVKPKHRASRGSSFRCQQQQQPQGQLDFTQLLQDELLQQLHPLPPLQQHPQQQCTPVLLMQQQHGSNLDIQPLPAAAVDPGSFSGLPQVPQTATWPLPGPAGGIGGGAGSGAVNIPGALPDSGQLPVGLQLGGLSDASLPLPGSWRQGPRLSCEGGGGSFVRKRDKMRMDLPAVCDDVLAVPELTVEQSGPSADVPTKRMSITLPGSNDVASLPTSFSGKVGSSAALLRPAPHELHQLMQLSSYEDTNDMLWQQQDQQLPVPQQQQYTQQQQYQQQPGLQGGQPGASGFTGLAGKLKKLLRGKKSKVQRFHSVGAGGSFSAAGPAATGRVASADAALAAQNPAWLPSTPAAPQLPAGAGSAGPWCADHRSALVQDRPPAAAEDRRLWHSMVQQPCEPHVSPAAVGGLSWHADRSTLLAGGNMATAAAAASALKQQQQQPVAAVMGAGPTGGQQLPAGAAASNGQFAQQLAQLRAIYGSQQAELDTEYGASAEVDTSTPAAAAGVEVAAADEPGNAGLMGRLVRALRLGDDPSTGLPDAASGRQDEAHGNQGNADLLILGRCDGELDLAKAAQRWQTGAAGDHQDVWTDIRGCQGAGSGLSPNC